MSIVRTVTLTQVELIRPGQPGNVYAPGPELAAAPAPVHMATFEFALEDPTSHAAQSTAPLVRAPGESIASFKVVYDVEELGPIALMSEYEIEVRPVVSR